MKKRIISGLLTIAMILTLLPTSAFAEDTEKGIAGQFDEVLECLEGAFLNAGEVSGEEIAEYAKTFIGYPYVYATHGPNSFDCSGFVYYVFSQFGIYLSQASSYYWNTPTACGTVIDDEDALPGDIISWSGHVGIYLGNDRMVHAANESLGVCTGGVSTFRKNGVTNPPHHFIRVRGVANYINDVTAPEISEVRISNVSSAGYTVTCTVTDDESGVARVQFPSWTDNRGVGGNVKDDLVSDWETNSSCSGERSDTRYTYRVKVSDHKNDTGKYITEIYAYDKRGNYSLYVCDPTYVEAGMYAPVVSYSTHMQSYGWLESVSDGYIAGVTGESKRMEALTVSLQNPDGTSMDPADGGVSYEAHVQSYGWMDWVADGASAGTSGESKRVEAIRIKLTGQIAEEYDIYYRAHAQGYGWLGWAKNGQSAGTEGYAYRLEAIQVIVLPKTESAPGTTYGAFRSAYGHTHDYVVETSDAPTCTQGGTEEVSCYCGAYAKRAVEALGHDYEAEIIKAATEEEDGTRKMTCTRCGDTYTESYSLMDPHVMYYTHVQTYGDLDWSMDGTSSGTTGEAKRLENIHVKIVDENGDDMDPSNLGVRYQAHCQTYGWTDWASNGDMGGTAGEAKRMEAIRLVLTGEWSDRYDIYYRAHAQSFGWLGWAKNGQSAGTEGYSYRLEAIQILIQPKGEAAPGASEGAFQSAYGHTHDYIADNPVTATCTQGGTEEVSCYCGAHTTRTVEPLGHDYQAEILEPATAEQDGLRRMTCTRCQDTYTETYSYQDPHVTYFTHVQTYGDLDWVTDGAPSGTTGESKRLENIHVKIVDGAGNDFDTEALGVSYQTHCQTYGWTDWVSNGAMGGTAGESKRMEAIELILTGELADQYDIYYCVHSQTFGWLGWAKNGERAGTSGLSKRLEALEIVLVKSGSPAPEALGTETRSYVTEE